MDNKELELNLKIKELYDKYEPHALFDTNKADFSAYQSNKMPALKFGDWFLYQLLDRSNMMSYPKLAIFVKHDILDMALEYQCVNYIKTWQQNCYIKNDYKGSSFKTYLDSYIHDFNYFHDWDDTIYIFDIWKSKPDKKDLRKAYEKTLWYYRTPYEKRVITLNSLV